jgi:hypothetical protein
VIISVIIGWKLNGCNMLCSTALCGLSLRLVSVGVQAVKVSILLTKKLLFLCIIELQNIYCFINSNQLYVKYICFA